MNQALGLTHLPGSQQQQDRAICSEETIIPQTNDQLTASPSAPSRTELREQSPDSLFGDDGTFELSWENELMDTLPQEVLPSSYSNEQNASDPAINIPETIQEGQKDKLQAASEDVEDINTPPVNPVGNQYESSCRKRPFDDDNAGSTNSTLENHTPPTKKLHVEQICPFDELPDSATITSSYHECENAQSASASALPPDFLLPDLTDIPEFLSFLQSPTGFDFDILNTAGSAEYGSSHDPGIFSSSNTVYNSVPPNNQIVEVEHDKNPGSCAPGRDSEDAQTVGQASETTTSTPRPSICSSLTPFSADSYDIHDSDKPHSERELSLDSLFGGTAPISAPALDNAAETNTAQHREENFPPQDVPVAIQFVENDITKNFRLEKEDILATRYREIFRHVPKPQGYISPYPKCRGPLGYFPSAPATHARCIEVAPDDMAERLEDCRRKLRKVSSERSRYINVWVEWKTVDPLTGKTKEQTLKEEPFRLKRALLAQERKAKEFSKQAEDWRGQYNNLALAYNGLVQHLHLLQAAQIPQRPPQVAYPPPGHPTPVPSPQPELITADSCVNLPPDPSETAQVTSQPTPITIDLTSDEPTNHNSNDPASASSIAEEHSRNHVAEQLRNAMCRKEYHWLGNKNRPPRRILPAPPLLGRDLGQESVHTPDRDLSTITPVYSATAATSGGSTTSEATIERLQYDANDNNDELAQALEAELERGISIES
ncbi:hypothetical protein EMPG_17713 [Blastomyces silverae]|uniref:Uncharacterized protein n=1 Tax=Blastomyces silverae TaxID=2060906 RepID=A0A0H1B601_9EURO|nr:hypothetical protein EMPG_17713 [Blastomyces silverae]